MRAPKRLVLFKKEADLCAAFISALPVGWTPYPETQGWDILLVHGTGIQVGVQAKLRFGIDVINQAIEDRRNSIEGPDYRAVLVPETGVDNRFVTLCAYTGITVLKVSRGRFLPALWTFGPPLPGTRRHDLEEWHDCCTARRHGLPEYVPDVQAGVAAPVQLTDWKVKAIKIAIILETRGVVTRYDFTTIGIDHRRWTAGGWLLPSNRGGWVAGDVPDFKTQHPRVYYEIAAEAAKWMPAPPLL